jgi:hypothetical protein
MPSSKVLGARGSCRPTEADVGSQAEAEITLSAPRGSVAVSLAHQVCDIHLQNVPICRAQYSLIRDAEPVGRFVLAESPILDAHPELVTTTTLLEEDQIRLASATHIPAPLPAQHHSGSHLPHAQMVKLYSLC